MEESGCWRSGRSLPKRAFSGIVRVTLPRIRQKWVSFMTLRLPGLVSATLLAFLVTLPSPAYAYLDPGTGSLILQAAIGTVAGVLVALRIYWQKIKAFFSTKSAVESAKDHDPDNP